MKASISFLCSSNRIAIPWVLFDPLLRGIELRLVGHEPGVRALLRKGRQNGEGKKQYQRKPANARFHKDRPWERFDVCLTLGGRLYFFDSHYKQKT